MPIQVCEIMAPLRKCQPRRGEHHRVSHGAIDAVLQHFCPSTRLRVHHCWAARRVRWRAARMVVEKRRGLGGKGRPRVRAF
jgi:hypothetical protein